MSAIKLAGVDEAGRGPLAGPVVAGAVILDPNKPIDGLMDSKKLTEKKREALFDIIQERALGFGIGMASVEEIDAINILQASLLAMQRAVQALPFSPDEIQVDGNRCPKFDIITKAIVRGDQLVPEISAASILAKVTRDRLMLELHQQFPEYQFDRHKGYPTALHMDMLKRFGPTPLHRRSFGPVKKAIIC